MPLGCFFAPGDDIKKVIFRSERAAELWLWDRRVHTTNLRCGLIGLAAIMHWYTVRMIWAYLPKLNIIVLLPYNISIIRCMCLSCFFYIMYLAGTNILAQNKPIYFPLYTHAHEINAQHFNLDRQASPGALNN